MTSPLRSPRKSFATTSVMSTRSISPDVLRGLSTISVEEGLDLRRNPDPTQYDLPPAISGHSTPRVKIGTAPRFAKGSADENPGPTEYQPGSLEKTLGGAFCNAGRPLEGKTSQSPGPVYSPRDDYVLQSQPSFSFTSGRAYTVGAAVSSSPGPAYNTATDLSRKGIKFGRAGRDEGLPPSQSPGPVYSPQYGEQAHAVFFGEPPKEKTLTILTSNPGPGQYKLPSFLDRRGTSFGKSSGRDVKTKTKEFKERVHAAMMARKSQQLNDSMNSPFSTPPTSPQKFSPSPQRATTPNSTRKSMSQRIHN